MKPSPYFPAGKIKVFIPTYQRAETIVTHKMFLNEHWWDLNVVVHTEEEKAEYLKHNPELEGRILVSLAEGIAGQRKYIDSLVRNGEWYLSGDDDIEALTGVRGALYQLPGMPVKALTKENYNNVLSEADVRHLMVEMMMECERIKCTLFGFNSIDNPFFRSTKWRKNAFIIGMLWGAKKSDEWEVNTDIKLKEDYERTAKHLLHHGGTLRNDYIGLKTKQFAKGGVGSYKDRTSEYELSVETLMKNYPKLFRKNMSRDNPNAEIIIIPRTYQQVAVWRLEMIVKKVLPDKYIERILSPGQAVEFRKKYNL